VQSAVQSATRLVAPLLDRAADHRGPATDYSPGIAWDQYYTMFLYLSSTDQAHGLSLTTSTGSGALADIQTGEGDV
jgi:hypothetical protein